MSSMIKRRKVLASALVLLLCMVMLLIQDQYHSQRVETALKPCANAMRLNPYSGGLPCYQAALRDDPGDQTLQVGFASTLVAVGRFEEARALYQKAAKEFGFDTNQARQMLQPGAMQKRKASMDQTLQAYREYNALVQQHGREAMAFQAAHDTDVEPYRTQMRELVKAHVRQEREMMIAKGVWKPSVLQEPYYLTRKH